jgi:hypothetical protein
MAKKTSYLTELIERHERWKAEGGERIEEEEPHPDVMELYVHCRSILPMGRYSRQGTTEMVMGKSRTCGISEPFVTAVEQSGEVQLKSLGHL